MSDKPKVLVTVGTDHHGFGRLIRWVDAWAADGGTSRAEVFVQHGSAPAPSNVASAPFLPWDELRTAMADADVVVCHAGPGSIMEARAVGRIPVVVPRRKRLGEIIDDHQRAFSRRLNALGHVREADDEQAFRRALDEAVERPSSFRFVPKAAEALPAVRRLEHLVERTLGEPRDARTRVLFIGGLERSGTTLADRMLGEVPGFCAVGEVVHLWDRGVAGGQLCGCGEPFERCGFWSEVGRAAFDGWERVDARAVMALQRSVDRHRNLPLMLAPASSPSYRKRMAEYLDLMGRLYAAIARVAGARVVVDSSKPASLAYLLRRASSVDLRVLHLVRDSRGVAHSSAKRVRRPEVVGDDRFMVRYGPGRTAGRWLVYNALFEGLAALGTPKLTVRYEDLVASPRQALDRIVRFADVAVEEGALGFVADRSVRLGPAHTVSGNPMRFETGDVPLRADDAWRRELPRRDAAVAAALSWPLLLRYGYRMRSSP